jgi:hypothetical protein
MRKHLVEPIKTLWFRVCFYIVEWARLCINNDVATKRQEWESLRSMQSVLIKKALGNRDIAKTTPLSKVLLARYLQQYWHSCSIHDPYAAMNKWNFNTRPNRTH